AHASSKPNDVMETSGYRVDATRPQVRPPSEVVSIQPRCCPNLPTRIPWLASKKATPAGWNRRGGGDGGGVGAMIRALHCAAVALLCVGPAAMVSCLGLACLARRNGTRPVAVP